MSEPNEERKGISLSEDKKSRKEQTNDIFSNILLFPFLLPVHFLLSFIPSISFFIHQTCIIYISYVFRKLLYDIYKS